MPPKAHHVATTTCELILKIQIGHLSGKTALGAHKVLEQQNLGR